jgi:hypothetical protein
LNKTSKLTSSQRGPIRSKVAVGPRLGKILGSVDGISDGLLLGNEVGLLLTDGLEVVGARVGD